MEENADVKSGFAVRMHFAENPFFSNSVLEKKVDYPEDGTMKLSSVPPQWRPGKVGIFFQCLSPVPAWPASQAGFYACHDSGSRLLEIELSERA